MPKKKKNTRVYLTKRAFIRSASKGVREAAQETVSVMGYNVIVSDGWLIRKFSDGRIEHLKKMETFRVSTLNLD